MKTHYVTGNKLLTLFLTVILGLSPLIIGAQTSSRNGYNLPVNGNFRVLMVFVEIDYSSNPSLDPSTSADLAIWPSGSFPTWKNNVFNPLISGTPSAQLSRYFYEASLGNYKVTGDYIDKVITIPLSKILPLDNQYAVANRIIAEMTAQLNAYGYHSGYGLSLNDMDQWRDNSTPGGVKTNAPDGGIDHVMVLMRNYHWFSASAGYASSGGFGNLWGYSVNSFSHFNARAGVPTTIAYHEYGHLLYGGNNFHCVGAGAGNYAFLFRTGGYSGLASSGRMCVSANAWDRRRLGWRHSSNTYDISARATDRVTEVNADIEKDSDLPQLPYGEMVLRDFWTYGDAVRIKLPYLQYGTGNENVLDQWLWIENRQVKSGSMFDLNPNAPKGIYAYIQVGKEEFDDFGGVGNYLHFLPALGNYDMTFDPSDPTNETVKISASSSNPFTGYNNLMQPPIDLNNNGIISRGDPNAELVHAKKLTINGNPLVSAYYVEPYVMTTGTQYDAFTTSVYDKIGIGYNPAAVPLMTYTSVYNGPPNSPPLATDNRTVHLNGISIEVMEEYSNGDIRIKVRFDDYKVYGSYRWCGNLMLHKKVEVQPGVNLSIDQGLSPQRPDSPQIIGGKNVFADPTLFTMEPLSVFKLETNSSVTLKGNSTFHIKGGILEIKDGAHFVVENGSTLILEPDGEIQVKPGGLLEVKNGGKLIIRKPKGTGSGNLTLGEYRPEAAPPSSSVPAELRMYGQLIFEGVNWEQTQNDGFFSFYSGSSVTLDAGKQVILSSIGENTKLLDLYTTLEIDGHNVNINHAKIKMSGVSTKLLTKNNDVSLDVLQVEGGGFEGDGVTSFDAYEVDVSGANKAFVLRNIAPSAGNIYVRYGNITSSNVGVSIHYADHAIIHDVDITAGTGIFAEHARQVTYKGEISATYGVDLDAVLGFYATAGVTHITGSNTGIRAENSLVFLRNGATVENSTRGIDIEGYWDESAGAYTSMLTVGDVGCGSIIQNGSMFSGKSIYGTDVVINIDATLHALAGGNAQNINPNNIYNDGMIDICYKDTTNSPDTIPAKGNFWNPTNYSVYKIIKKCPGFCRTGNQSTCDPIVLDNSQPSTCDPEEGICSICGTRKIFIGSIFEQGIFEDFAGMYNAFTENDNYDNRSKFGEIAAYSLIKQSNAEGTTWIAKLDDDNQHIISTETVHIIQVAKVIYNARGEDPSGGSMMIPLSADKDEDILKDNSDELNIEVVPNPAQSEVSINIKGTDNIRYDLVIYNSIGMVVKRASVVNGSNKLNISDIAESGIYYIKVTGSDQCCKGVKKLIIQH